MDDTASGTEREFRSTRTSMLCPRASPATVDATETRDVPGSSSGTEMPAPRSFLTWHVDYGGAFAGRIRRAPQPSVLTAIATLSRRYRQRLGDPPSVRTGPPLEMAESAVMRFRTTVELGGKTRRRSLCPMTSWSRWIRESARRST